MPDSPPDGLVALNVRVEREMRTKLKVHAANEGVSMRQLVTDWLDERLASLPDDGTLPESSLS